MLLIICNNLVLFHLFILNDVVCLQEITTGIRGIAECRPLCRVSFVRHSAKQALPRAALGKVRLSATSLFTECWTLDTGPHSPTTRHSAKAALSKGPSAAVLKLTAVSFAES
jgi:hypothetical protein